MPSTSTRAFPIAGPDIVKSVIASPENGYELVAPSSSTATTDANDAVTVVTSETSTVQVGSVPAQAPAHPSKTEAESGTASSVTVDPAGTISEQVEPQSMPAGVDVTVPPPVPPSDTESG